MAVQEFKEGYVSYWFDMRDVEILEDNGSALIVHFRSGTKREFKGPSKERILGIFSDKKEKQEG